MIDKLTADKIRKFYTPTDEVLRRSDFSEADQKILIELKCMGFIEMVNPPYKLDEFKLTSAARQTLEEYDRAQETVEAAKNANRIADEANAIAKRSNVIAVISLVISGISIILSVLLPILLTR